MQNFRLQQPNAALTCFGRSVCVLAMLLVSLVSYLAVNPAAHEFFHQDAGHESHGCVVTAFAAGEGLFTPPTLDLRPAPLPPAALVVWLPLPAPSAPTLRLPPVCGPPALA